MTMRKARRRRAAFAKSKRIRSRNSFRARGRSLALEPLEQRCLLNGSSLVELTVQWSTYVGGKFWDEGYTVALDPDGNTYVAGYTLSPDWSPELGYIPNHGGRDAFVAKISAGGSGFEWVRLLGGSGVDCARNIAVDQQTGDVIVTGYTNSTDWDLGGADPDLSSLGYHGGYDVFVTRLSADGTQQWTRYFGGSLDDRGRDVAIDPNDGTIVVGGDTRSSDWMASGYQGGRDAFLLKLQPDGTSLWSRYFGGGRDDDILAIAIDAEGNIVGCGGTWSSDLLTANQDEMAAPNAFDPTFNGGAHDGYVAKFDGDGVLQWASFIGSSGGDVARSVAVDSQGHIYLGGDIHGSSGLDFLNSYMGGYDQSDAVLLRIAPNGDLEWGRYVATPISGETVTGLAVDSSGNAILSGQVVGGDATFLDQFPNEDAYDSTYGDPSMSGGDHEGYLAVVSPDGTPQWGTFLGGSGFDFAYDVAVDASGVVVGGVTQWSTDFPVYQGPDLTKGGVGGDAFAARFLIVPGTAPIACDDAYEMAEDTQLAVDAPGVLSNDTDPNGDSLVVHDADPQTPDIDPVSGPMHGTLDLHADGSFVYTPVADFFHGTDTFTYQAFDGEEVSGVATVRIQVVTEPVVIEPTVQWSTYVGGNELERNVAVATDSQGNTYVAGHTGSTYWSPQLGPLPHHGGWDTFVAKIPAGGSGFEWVQLLGGSSWEHAGTIAVDQQTGDVIVTGYTLSTDWDLGGADPDLSSLEYHGGYDVFVTRLSADGTQQWTRYFGGSSDDRGRDVAIDPNDGTIVVGGDTRSSDWMASGYQGGRDAFLLKLQPDGTLLWSRYFGGGSDDDMIDIAIDAEGNIVGCGSTWSSDLLTANQDEMAAPNAFDPTFNGGAHDGYVAKFDGNGVLQWASFIGSSGDEIAESVAVDSQGYIYLGSGIQGSSGLDFLNSYMGGYDQSDAVLLRIAPNGDLDWGRYVGTPVSAEGVSGLAVDSSGNAILTGVVVHGDATFLDQFPNEETYDPTYGGDHEGYLAVVSPDGTPQWGTFLGGSGFDWGLDVAVDASGVVVGGITTSSDFPVYQGPDLSYGGNWEAFAARFLTVPATAPIASDDAYETDEDTVLVTTPSGLGLFYEQNLPGGDAPNDVTIADFRNL